MTNQEILEKAVQKAIEGGWQPDPRKWVVRYTDSEYFESTDTLSIVFLDPHNEDKFEKVLPAMMFIFTHDFAKALWGERNVTATYEAVENGKIVLTKDPSLQGKIWQHRLQQMVISDDPIEYLGENI